MGSAEHGTRSQRAKGILDAAASVFSERGFDRATTREIAATAGVSEGTLYNYFDSKRDMLLALIDQLGEEYGTFISQMEATTFQKRYASLLEYAIQSSRALPRWVFILQQAMLDEEVGRRLDAVISQAMDYLLDVYSTWSDEGLLGDTDPRVAVEAFGGLLMGQVIGIELASRGHHREMLTPDQMSRALADVVMNGLRPRMCTSPLAEGDAQREATEPERHGGHTDRVR